MPNSYRNYSDLLINNSMGIKVEVLFCGEQQTVYIYGSLFFYLSEGKLGC